MAHTIFASKQIPHQKLIYSIKFTKIIGTQTQLVD